MLAHNSWKHKCDTKCSQTACITEHAHALSRGEALILLTCFSLNGCSQQTSRGSFKGERDEGSYDSERIREAEFVPRV